MGLDGVGTRGSTRLRHPWRRPLTKGPVRSIHQPPSQLLKEPDAVIFSGRFNLLEDVSIGITTGPRWVMDRTQLFLLIFAEIVKGFWRHALYQANGLVHNVVEELRLLPLELVADLRLWCVPVLSLFFQLCILLCTQIALMNAMCFFTSFGTPVMETVVARFDTGQILLFILHFNTLQTGYAEEPCFSSFSFRLVVLQASDSFSTFVGVLGLPFCGLPFVGGSTTSTPTIFLQVSNFSTIVAFPILLPGALTNSLSRRWRLAILAPSFISFSLSFSIFSFSFPFTLLASFVERSNVHGSTLIGRLGSGTNLQLGTQSRLKVKGNFISDILVGHVSCTIQLKVALKFTRADVFKDTDFDLLVKSVPRAVWPLPLLIEPQLFFPKLNCVG